MRLLPVATILAVASFASAGDLEVQILEPREGFPVIRRNMDVIASVGSTAKADSVSLVVVDEKGKKEKFDLAPLAGRPGCFSATVAVGSGKLELKVKAEGPGGTAKATRKVSVERGLKESALAAPGSKAPSATAKDVDGNEVAIDSKKGPVLVHFYSAWDDCELEVKWLKKLEKKYGKQGLTIVGVASVVPTDYKAWTAYLEKLGAAKWKNVPDPDGSIADEWWGCSHAVAGSQAPGAIMYFMKNGKIEGGDYISYDYVGRVESCCTEDALKRVFP